MKTIQLTGPSLFYNYLKKCFQKKQQMIDVLITWIYSQQFELL